MAPTDINILSAGAVAPGLKKISEEFQRETHQRVYLEFATAPAIFERLRDSAPMDLVIAPSTVLDDLVRDGRIFLESIVWTVMNYNPVRILGLIGLFGVGLALLIGRLERTQAPEGTFSYTLDDVAKAEADLEKMAADVAHRRFVCSECGRVMRRREADDDDGAGDD